jgi:hypothetical protein
VAVFPFPVVLLCRAVAPVAVLPVPVVLEGRAWSPTAVFNELKVLLNPSTQSTQAPCQSYSTPVSTAPLTERPPPMLIFEGEDCIITESPSVAVPVATGTFPGVKPGVVTVAFCAWAWPTMRKTATLASAIA